MPKLNANLNYFFALVIAGSIITCAWIVPPIKRLLLHHGKINPLYDNMTYIAIILVVCLVSATWWMRHNLVPTLLFSEARWVLRIGTVAMAIGNGAIALALIVSIIGVAVNHNFGLAVGFAIALAFMLASPLYIAGIVCVEISRLLNRFQSSRLKNEPVNL